jgi:predicted AlkP superfamily pyrophosphatase or phosphodiesterase
MSKMISKPLFLIMIDGLGYDQTKEEQMPFLTRLLGEDKHKLRTPLGYSG